MVTELLTFAVAFLARALQQHFSNRLELRSKELDLLSRNQELVHEGRQTIRAKIDNGLFGVTTSVLALMAFFSIILLPKLCAVFFPEVAVSFAYYGTDKGFLFFTSDTTQMFFRQFKGLVITPLDTQLISAIAGLYFGSIKTGISRR